MHVAPDNYPAFESACRALVSQRAHRWAVAVSAVPNRPDYPVEVVLEHPLSNGVGWSPSPHEIEQADTTFLEGIIERDRTGELGDIAEAPTECAHSSFLLALRLHARRFEWTHEECRALALILGEAGNLDPAEAEWFANFTGINAPHEHGPWPQPAR